MSRACFNYDLNVKNTFPARGRAWCKWEEDFLLDWLEAFGLDECARQLGRTPASVALRCAWLGIRRPAKASAEAPASKPESKPKQGMPKEAPRSPAEAKEGIGTGEGAGRVPEGADGALKAESGNAAAGSVLDMVEHVPSPPAAPSMPKKLSKAGVPWTSEEDETLLRLRSLGWTYERCAGELPGRNKSSCSSRYLKLCKEGSSDTHRQTAKRESSEQDELKPLEGRRRCHDCGKPTADFRCAECWKKIRGSIALEEDGI